MPALRVDGGASVMDLLLQMQADQIRVPVERPATAETTALGAAWLAGLAEGVWGSLDELSALWSAGGIVHARGVGGRRRHRPRRMAAGRRTVASAGPRPTPAERSGGLGPAAPSWPGRPGRWP